MNEWIGARLTDLALFASVVDQGGFTAAARKTGIPQSTISRRIGHLEAQLGARLIDRTTRHMRLTEIGQRTLDHVRLMLEAGAAAISAADLLKEAPSGVLRISAPVMLARSVLPDVVRRYMHQYPGVSVALEFTTRGLDPVDDEVDIAIRLGIPERSSARLHSVFSARPGLFAAPSFAGQMPVSPADLAGQEIFAATRGPMAAELTFKRDKEAITVSASLRLRSNDINVVIDAAEACQGFALIPVFAAPAGWRQVCRDWLLPAHELNALTTRHGSSLPRIAAFISLLQAETALLHHPPETP